MNLPILRVFFKTTMSAADRENKPTVSIRVPGPGPKQEFASVLSDAPVLPLVTAALVVAELVPLS